MDCCCYQYNLDEDDDDEDDEVEDDEDDEDNGVRTEYLRNEYL